MGVMDMWTYRETTWSTEELVGFSVEALDGGIGKIDEATNESPSATSLSTPGPGSLARRSCSRRA